MKRIVWVVLFILLLLALYFGRNRQTDWRTVSPVGLGS
jgi:hypothetical protein